MLRNVRLVMNTVGETSFLHKLLRAIDSLRKQLFYLLKDTGLVDNVESCNTWSHDEHLIRAITCAGLFPGICSVVNKDKSISLKTMEDGTVLLHSNSLNAQEPKIPYPWLVFNEKLKVNSVFLWDSTAVFDSVVLLFGGNISRGGLLMNPKLDINNHNELLSAVRLVVTDDQCDGRFVFGCRIPTPSKMKSKVKSKDTLFLMSGGDNSKNHLQTLLSRAGHEPPTYKTKQLKNKKFCSTVILNGLDFVGQSCSSKKLAEKDAASEALQWLTGETQSIDHMSTILTKS